jgi:hypothetical protein
MVGQKTCLLHYYQLKILLFFDDDLAANLETFNGELRPVLLVPFSVFIQHCQVIA